MVADEGPNACAGEHGSEHEARDERVEKELAEIKKHAPKRHAEMMKSYEDFEAANA